MEKTITREYSLRFESVIAVLSECYVLLRGKEATGDVIWKSPSTFERRTTKYWIPSSSIVPLQLAIINHLPILNFTGNDDGNLNYHVQELDAKKITSVYFDNTDLRVYHERLEKLQGASLLLFRWYGSKKFFASEDDDIDLVFIERKTHHESCSLENSVKERFALSKKEARDFFESVAKNIDLSFLDVDD